MYHCILVWGCDHFDGGQVLAGTSASVPSQQGTLESLPIPIPTIFCQLHATGRARRRKRRKAAWLLDCDVAYGRAHNPPPRRRVSSRDGLDSARLIGAISGSPCRTWPGHRPPPAACLSQPCLSCIPSSTTSRTNWCISSWTITRIGSPGSSSLHPMAGIDSLQLQTSIRRWNGWWIFPMCPVPSSCSRLSPLGTGIGVASSAFMPLLSRRRRLPW